MTQNLNYKDSKVFLELPSDFQLGSGEYQVVICEKPLAAKRISEVLGSKKLTKREPMPGVIIFDVISDDNVRYVVCSAFGHLYGLFPVEKNRKKYPIYDVKWSPRISKVRKEKKRISQTLQVISDISPGASGFIHACDYDLEGELIGYNILQFACDNKYEVSKRAKFSSLTENELINSFRNLQLTDIRNANAGIARHLVDFIFGVNLSRALICSVNVSNYHNKYCNLSIGRVQGPTLKFVVDREIKISGYVPDPMWYITGKFEKDGSFFKANLITSIYNSSDTGKILSVCKNQTGIVDNIVKFDKVIHPHEPFNVSNLQKEAYRIFKISPAATLSIAESLYLAALISYPRTSSQKLPPSIGYRQILEQLKVNYFQTNENIVNDILKRDTLSPHQGKEVDPAHPAIYPTGVKQKKLNVLERKILDLVVKRFVSTFGNNAVIRYSEVKINVNGYYFQAKSNCVLNKGWIHLYEPYFSINESYLPELKISDSIKVSEIKSSEDYSRPPARYNQASLLDKMESEGIGTKSTRAAIIDLLIKRKYIYQDKNGIEPTDLGFAILNTMKKFASEIISTKLTSFLESNIKKIQEGALEIDDVRLYLEKKLSNPINEFKLNQSVIGTEIRNVLSSINNRISLGICPKCQKGEMIIIRSTKTKKRFLACSQFRVTGCNAMAALPQKGLIKKDSTCYCGWPTLRIKFARRKMWTICVNRICSKNRNNFASHYDSESNALI